VPSSYRGILTPDTVDELVGGHDPARLDEQDGEHGPSAGVPDVQIPSVDLNADVAEHGELDPHSTS
jgi:hypothetical protein